MEDFLKRANQADDLLAKLTARVEALEKGGAPAAAPAGGMVLVDPNSEMMTEKARIKIRGMVMQLKKECEDATKTNEKLEAENKKLKAELKAQLKKGGSAPSGNIEKQMQKALQQQQPYLNQSEPLKKVVESLKKWRNDVVALQEERDSLKKQIESGAAGGGMNPDQISSIRAQLVNIREEVVKYMKQQGEMVEAVAGTGGNTLSGMQRQTMDTIKDLKYYTVTTDLADLKKQWMEAELGELDDEDYELYLGREVRVIEIEEDDDTINVRFDNHDTQWFPVGCLYKKVEGAAPAAAPAASAESGMVQMTMDTIRERKYYYVTKDLAQLKAAWEEAELGELDDEDFELYLGRKVYAVDIEEDDDTMNVRFDNHDTQWFPVSTLYEKVEGAAPAAQKPAAASEPGMVQMTMDTIKERKYYFVTKDLGQLKKAWEEAELGELDDEDFQLYLGRKVYAIDLEEDDDTMNVRFDNHDTQWFPVSTLYMKSETPAAPAKKAGSSANAGRTQMNMDTIKERKYYFVTTDMAQLKAAWAEAELGELDDEDFELYLNRKVYAIDLEEDDDTMNVRFDNHDTQWFPVSCLYQEGASAASSPNGKRKQMTMDTIKERKYYFVTKCMKQLKQAWAEAELGELDDEDFQLYLGRKVYAVDLEEDDDTMNVRFDNHDTQWFPVSTLYQE